MRRIAVHGAGAARAAAGLIRSLRAAGGGVAVAYAGAEAPDADFVTADGRFLPNDAFWLEWASDRALPVGVPSDLPETAILVLAAPDPAAIPAEGFERLAAADLSGQPDLFGRLGSPPPVASSRACRIGVVGDVHHHRHVYPAVLARLGDAAERAGLAVEPVFVSGETVPDGLFGMILPGGADMAQVPRQISAANRSFAQGLPTFGLCLGMQTMLTARVRDTIWPDAMLEEVAGPGPRRSFVRLCAADGTALHRLGERNFTPTPGTRLAALLPRGAAIRVNHRYRVNPEIDSSRLRDVVLHWSGDLVDAVEVPAHPFFMGLQGHPELGCDPALAGLWDGFVRAATRFQTGQSR